jgi:DNA-binding beta-propeller fold protein YncE
MRLRRSIALLVGTALAGSAGAGWAGPGANSAYAQRWQYAALNFQRIATLANYHNNAELGDETVSEIVAATADGMTLVYTDAELEQIGFVDITTPAAPQPDGVLDVGGEPTSVDILGNSHALVAVNTSPGFVSPSGELLVVNLGTRTVDNTIDLGGQPDSIKISPDGQYVAVVIENERNEDIVVDGEEGGLPQLPAGYLRVIKTADWSVVGDADLTGLSAYGPSDPEPEFVDVNDLNQAVITLQENNHIAIVDPATASVTGHFDAGTVTLKGVDAIEDELISLSDTLNDVPREPDAVTWVKDRRSGEYLIVTANEGDLFGGSRGFTLYRTDGAIVYDSDTSYEELAVRFGHYPEDRSENKGSEPEGVTFGHFGRDDYLFVGSERGSFIAVYEMHGVTPRFKQVLPGPLGPEGLLAIP